MGMTFKRTGRFVARSVLTLCALMLLALMAVQLVLVVGINLVSTGKGSNFIAGKINEALVDSGYQIGFDNLYYDPVRGFTVYNLAVSDRQGEFLTLDRFSLAPSFALAPVKTLDLHARGGTLAVARLPIATQNEAERKGNVEPFETPDIYFRTITLSNLSFEHVNVSEGVAGQAYTFSPTLRGRLTFKDSLGLDFVLKPGMAEIENGLDAPDTINITGSLMPATLDFTLDDFSAQADDYALNVNASGNLSGAGHIDLEAQARHDDLSLLTQDMFGAVSAKLSMTGPLGGPAMDLSVLLATKSLKERGLSDITFSFKTEDISNGIIGQAKLETAFQDESVTLESAVSYQTPLLHMKDILGSAPELRLTGNGIFSTQSALFDGALSLSADNLARYSDLVGTSLAGKLEAKATLTPAPDGQQSADISLSASNAAYDTIKIKSLSAQAAFASLSTPWPQSATLNASSLRISDNASFDAINAKITGSRDESYKLTLKGNGRAPFALSFNGSALMSDLMQKFPSAKDIVLDVRHGGSTVTLNGDVAQDAIDLKLTTRNFRGRDIPAALAPQFEALEIDLDAAMTGTPSNPVSTLSAKLQGVGLGPYQDASLSVQAKHDGQNVSAILGGRGTGIRELDVTASLPMTLSLLPFDFGLDENAPLTGTIAADIDLGAISPLFLPATQTLTGRLRTDGAIGGTVAAPAPTATLRLDNVDFEDGQNGIMVVDLKAVSALTKDSLTLKSLTASDGKAGTLEGGGTLSFIGGGTSINLRLRDFNAPQANLANGIVSADLLLKGSSEGMALSGRADIAEMNVLIPETFSSRIPQLNIVEDEAGSGPGLFEQLSLDIIIQANNQVFVRGWGLDAEFEGNVAITGTAAAPQFNGSLSSRRGRYEEFGKRFTLARADLRFQGRVPPSPYLDIEATTPAGEVTGSVLLSGPVQSPSISFASTPALPEDEVLSRILFGKDSSKISPFQAVQLAQTISRFSGKGGSNFDPLGSIRSATGLDDISIETDDSGETNVGAGKYLSDNVYLEVSKGKADNSGDATIQIEVTPFINIESQIGQDAQGGGGIFWKHDY